VVESLPASQIKFLSIDIICSTISVALRMVYLNIPQNSWCSKDVNLLMQLQSREDDMLRHVTKHGVNFGD